MNRAVKHCAYRTGDFGRAGTFAFFMEKAAVKPYVNTLIDDNIKNHCYVSTMLWFSQFSKENPFH